MVQKWTENYDFDLESEKLWNLVIKAMLEPWTSSVEWVKHSLMMVYCSHQGVKNINEAIHAN